MTKLKLNLAQGAGEILTREELKKIVGGTEGSGSGSGNLTLCVANKDWRKGEPYSCFTSATEAETFAGADGYWCCNCQTAFNHCMYMGEW